MRITRKSSCTGHQAALYALAKSHTPGHFLTAGGDGWITEWNLADTETGKVVVNVESKVFSMAVSPIDWPEPLILAGNMTGGLHWANREQPALTKNIQHHTKSIFDIFWLDDEVFTVGGDGCLTRWNATKKTAMETYQLSNRALRCIAFCPIQQVFAVGASDGCIYYLRRDDFALLEKVSAHDNSVFSVAWARDGQQLISGGRDALLKVWSPYSTNISSQPGHWYTINHIALSPDGRLTATASRDKTIKIWKTEGMQLLKVVETIRDLGHVNSVNRLLWMDEHTLVSCSDDRSAVVWDCTVDPQIDSLLHAQIPLALSRNSPLTPPQSSSPEPLNL